MEIVASVAAASSVLEQLERIDAAAFAAVAEKQRRRVELAIQSKSLTLEDMAAITNGVAASKFPQTDKDAILRATVATEVMTPSAGSSKFQNFETILNFLPSSLVNLAGTASFNTGLVHFALRLGLRKPSEVTFKELAILMLIGTEGIEKAVAFSLESRAAMIETCKAWFRKAVAKMPAPAPWVTQLPDSPADLKVSHPDLHEAIYSTDPPAKLSVDHVHLEMMRSSTRCRKMKSRSFASLPQTAPPGVVTWTDLRQFMQAATSSSSPRLEIFGQPSTSLVQQPAWWPQQLPRQAQAPAPAAAPALLPPPPPDQRLAVPPLTPATAPLTLAQVDSRVSVVEENPGQERMSVDEVTAELEKAMAEKAAKSKGAMKKPAAFANSTDDAKQADEAHSGSVDDDNDDDDDDEPVKHIMMKPSTAKALLKTTDKMAPKAVSKKAPKKKPPPSRKICLTHEASRSQYLVRFEGEPSKVFRYGDTGKQGHFLTVAKRRIRTLCKKRGIAPPPCALP